VIKLKNIYKSFKSDNDSIDVLNDVSLEINKGEICLIYGNSGVGKSTLLSIVGTLESPSSGDVFIDDELIDFSEDLSHVRSQKLGFVFQNNFLLPEFNVLENLIVPQLINGKSFSESKKNSLEMLSVLRLEKIKDRYYNQISGGEKQRVSLVRSLVNNPLLVIADEPTANLDEKNCKQILDLIVKLNKEMNKSFLIATHDERFKKISNCIYNLFDGDLIKNV
tara:strand:+ start:1367 stop:2032 length:666 start_codon:yes stop_codon:yes gene_type:complete